MLLQINVLAHAPCWVVGRKGGKERILVNNVCAREADKGRRHLFIFVAGVSPFSLLSMCLQRERQEGMCGTVK